MKNLRLLIASATIFLTSNPIGSIESPELPCAAQAVQTLILVPNTASTETLGIKQLSVLDKLCGQEILAYPIAMLATLNTPITIALDPEHETIKKFVSERYGTTTTSIGIYETDQGPLQALAHTLAQCTPVQKDILVMYGNTPLITADIMDALYKKHCQDQATLSLVVTCLPGRQNANTPNDQRALEYNPAGIYFIETSFLTSALEQIETKEKTDLEKTSAPDWITALASIAQEKNKKINLLCAPLEKVCRVATAPELYQATRIQLYNLIIQWMNAGVQFTDPDTVHIDTGVRIGQQTIIDSNVHLTGSTVIGQNCHIHNFSELHNTTLSDNVTIFSHSILNLTTVGAFTEVGPFAHLHNNASVGDHSAIGNFVEVQLSTVGSYSKARHLTYLGHAQIGNRVNIGAGTITCNYDGRNKNKTTIEDNTFIGSNNTLVAPITIKKGSFTAAGSVITDTVPENTFAIGRARQVNKIDYAQKLREQVQQKNQSK